MAQAFALALAVALLDVTLGYPPTLARAIGSPASWLKRWLGAVKIASADWGGRIALALYLLPVFVAAALTAELLPANPLGFLATALLASAFCGRQRLDAQARAVARAWESDGSFAALAEAEALGGDEAETRPGRSAAAALAARFADEVAGLSLCVVFGGLAGAALFRALTVAGRACRERRETTAFARAVAEAERWIVTPLCRVGAVYVALAGGRGLSLAAGPAARPTAPAEAAMLAALGPAERDEPGYVRRALAVFRRAAAMEMGALGVLSLAFAFA